MKQLTSEQESRFWSKVRKGGDSECWEWTAYKSRGYGSVTINGLPRLAHRISFMIANGPIEDGMFICHRCDNPSCVNPDHLFKGTPLDNAQDMVLKGRQNNALKSAVLKIRAARGDRNGSRTKPERIPRGERHYRAKLHTADVLKIYHQYKAGGVRQRELAAEYGVHIMTINGIVNRREWKHILLAIEPANDEAA